MCVQRRYAATAAVWPGYFEGAIDSGYRAAGKVGAWLDAHPKARPHPTCGDDSLQAEGAGGARSRL